jgi:hypothetical protein
MALGGVPVYSAVPSEKRAVEMACFTPRPDKSATPPRPIHRIRHDRYRDRLSMSAFGDLSLMEIAADENGVYWD